MLKFMLKFKLTFLYLLGHLNTLLYFVQLNGIANNVKQMDHYLNSNDFFCVNI